jgi:hypothetical protein
MIDLASIGAHYKIRTRTMMIAAVLHDVVVSFALGTQRFGTLPKRSSCSVWIRIGITRGGRKGTWLSSTVVVLIVFSSWNAMFFFEFIRIGTINIHF